MKESAMHSVLTCLDSVLVRLFSPQLSERGVEVKNFPLPEDFQKELQRRCRAGQTPQAVVTGVQRLTCELVTSNMVRPRVDHYGNDNLFTAVSGEVPVIIVYGSSALVLEQDNNHLPKASASQIIYIPVEEVEGLVGHLMLAFATVKS